MLDRIGDPASRGNGHQERQSYRSRPKIKPALEKQIQDHLRTGAGILKVAELCGVGSGTVQRVKAEMSGPFGASAGVEMFSTI